MQILALITNNTLHLIFYRRELEDYYYHYDYYYHFIVATGSKNKMIEYKIFFQVKLLGYS